MSHCLDSWAILAWLRGDAYTANLVDDIVLAERPPVSWINLVEVEYQLRRVHGPEEASGTLDDVRAVVAEELPGVARMRLAAALKADHAIALADCFAIATATVAEAALVTGDPEIIDREARLPCAVLDARRSSQG